MDSDPKTIQQREFFVQLKNYMLIIMLQMQVMIFYVYFNNFRKSLRKEVENFSKKSTSIRNNGKLLLKFLLLLQIII